MDHIKNGSYVRDTITGLEGTLIARTVYLNGCITMGIQPHQLKDGRPIDVCWFDEVQVELVPAAEEPIKKSEQESTGGPPRSVASRSTPGSR